MKVLLIGGTGVMSTEVSKLAVSEGMELTMLNRRNHPERIPEGAEVIEGSIDDPAVQERLKREFYDVVMDFIVFTPDQAKRDVELFNGRCGHYLVVTSACIYEKPIKVLPATEGSTVGNSPWDYAKDKMACEEVYRAAYKELGFPVTMVRPSHTYCDWALPVSLTGKGGGWNIISRMKRGLPVLVQGDGLTVWTITHGRDVAKGMVGLFGNGSAIGEAVHITTDEFLTWDEIYRDIARPLGAPPRLVHVSTEMLCHAFPGNYGQLFGDISHCGIYDNTKIKRLVPGFCATTTAARGLRDAVMYHLAHPELQVEDPDFDRRCEEVLEAVEAFNARFD